MNSNELYDEFLKHCKNYEIDPYGIILKNETIYLKIMKPHNPNESNHLIYEIRDNARISGFVSDIDELLEICMETVGEDFIIINNDYGYEKKRWLKQYQHFFIMILLLFFVLVLEFLYFYF